MARQVGIWLRVIGEFWLRLADRHVEYMGLLVADEGGQEEEEEEVVDWSREWSSSRIFRAADPLKVSQSKQSAIIFLPIEQSQECNHMNILNKYALIYWTKAQSCTEKHHNFLNIRYKSA